ncbi:MAG: hypothetical protein ACK5NF_00830 [Bacilli bacterium]
MLISDYSILNEQGTIYDINGKPLSYSEDENITYYIDKDYLARIHSLAGYEKVQIKDNGKHYDTLSPFTTTVKLRDVVLIIYGSESLYVSNVYIKAKSNEHAEQIFTKVYKNNNIDLDVSVVELGQDQFKNQANNAFKENVVTSIVAIICILLANIFYTLLVFQNNKNKILISNIFGQNYYNRMSCVIKYFLIVWLFTIVIMIIVGVYAMHLYLVVFIAQFIVMNLYIKYLTKKSIVKHLKEEL